MSDAVDIATGLLSQVNKLLRKLSPAQISQLSDGSASIAFVPAGHRVTAPRVTAPKRATSSQLDVSDLASSLRGLTSDQVIARLLPDRKVTVAVVDQLARKLDVTIPSSAKRRDDKISVLAESLVGYRENAEAVMSGAYRV